MGFGVRDLGFRIQGKEFSSNFRVLGYRVRVGEIGLMVYGLG